MRGGLPPELAASFDLEAATAMRDWLRRQADAWAARVRDMERRQTERAAARRAVCDLREAAGRAGALIDDNPALPTDVAARLAARGSGLDPDALARLVAAERRRPHFTAGYRYRRIAELAAAGLAPAGIAAEIGLSKSQVNRIIAKRRDGARPPGA